MMRIFKIGLICVALSPPSADFARAQTYPPTHLSSRDIPIPDTVSTELQRLLAAQVGLKPLASQPATNAQWLQFSGADQRKKYIADLLQRFQVTMTKREIAGVGCFLVIPPDIPRLNRDRLLVHVHGGGYVLFPLESGTGEDILMAAHARMRVLSIDYRLGG